MSGSTGSPKLQQRGQSRKMRPRKLSACVWQTMTAKPRTGKEDIIDYVHKGSTFIILRVLETLHEFATERKSLVLQPNMIPVA
nr:hypothetical protein Iba_chr08dCG10480 [Ipomoea batatas]GMD27095.1 hypothetical protein Iba_chr08dCG10490 [Ipomoea batatas]